MSSRHDIGDGDWVRISPFLPGRVGGHGGVGFDTRLSVNAVLDIAVTGIARADLPHCYGKSNGVWQRYNRRCRIGVWQKVAAELRDGDTEWLCVDGSCVRATGAAAGAKKKRMGVAVGRPRRWGVAAADSPRKSTPSSTPSAIPWRSD